MKTPKIMAEHLSVFSQSFQPTHSGKESNRSSGTDSSSPWIAIPSFHKVRNREG